MSTHSTMLDAHGAVETSTRATGKGFWRRLFDRMVAARQAQANREIAAYLQGLSEQERRNLGYPTLASFRSALDRG
jgi:hypothetical protein